MIIFPSVSTSYVIDFFFFQVGKNSYELLSDNKSNSPGLWDEMFSLRCLLSSAKEMISEKCVIRWDGNLLGMTNATESN